MRSFFVKVFGFRHPIKGSPNDRLHVSFGIVYVLLQVVYVFRCFAVLLDETTGVKSLVVPNFNFVATMRLCCPQSLFVLLGACAYARREQHLCILGSWIPDVRSRILDPGSGCLLAPIWLRVREVSSRFQRQFC